MSKRAEALADRIQQGVDAMVHFVGALSDLEWATNVVNEGRTVGVLMHHVAISYQAEVDLALEIASGKPITGVTADVVDAINAQHALAHALATKRETIALLSTNGAAAATRVRMCTDEQLDRAATVSLYADAPLTAQFFIEDHALRHSFHHMANIRAALKR